MSTCEGCQPKPTYTEAVKRYQKCAVVDCTYVTVDVVETIDIYGASTFEVSLDGNVVTPTPQLLECKDPIPTVPACAAGESSSIESDSIEMCDEGTTFLRWFVKANGVPTGEIVDTTIAGATYTASGLETVGACNCSDLTNRGLSSTW